MLAHRLLLSRLQARLASLEPGVNDAHSEWLGGDLVELDERTVDPPDRAWRSKRKSELQGMSLADAYRPCQRSAQAARDEISETIAFLEDMPLRRAVKRLELAEQDLAKPVHDAPSSAHPVGIEKDARGAERAGARGWAA